MSIPPQIFLSYSWSNSEIAELIDSDFQSLGITLLRDIRDAKFRTSIKSFMHKIGKSDYVLMMLSDEYLRSENCMYEVLELLNSHELEKRILPILVQNAQSIFSSIGRLKYYDFWREKKKLADVAFKNHPNEDNLQIKKQIDNINLWLDKFFIKIIDLKILEFVDIRRLNYKPLMDIIGLKEDETIVGEILTIKQIPDEKEKELALLSLLMRHPNNKHALFQMAYTVTKTKPEFAKIYFELLFSYYPDYSSDAHFHYSTVLFENFNEYDLAIVHLEKSISLNPQNINAHEALGNLLLYTFHDHKKAYTHFNACVELDANHYRAYYALGIIYINFSKIQLAKANFETAIQINPSFELAYYHLGSVLDHGYHDYKNARKLYEIAIELNPDYLSPYESLVPLLVMRFNEYVSAKVCFNKIMEIDPNNCDALVTYGVLLYSFCSEYETAQELLEKAIILSPNDPHACHALGTFYLTALNDYKNARFYIERTIELDLTDGSAYYNLGLLINNNFIDEAKLAIDCLQKAVKLCPDDYEFHFQLAIVLHTNNQYEEALSHYNTSLNLKPDFPKVYNNLSILYHEYYMDYKTELTLLERAIELDPNYYDAHYNLGDLFAEQGNYLAAIKHYEFILSIAEAEIPLYKKLSKAYLMLNSIDKANRYEMLAEKLEGKLRHE